MSFFLRLKFITILSVLLWSLPCIAEEAFLNRIAVDFRNVGGYVVEASGNEIIIDLDSSHGVVPGDVFCVFKPGRNLIHPVTGKVVGVLEETKGFLKITRIKTGYSFARRITMDADIGPGDAVRRYENLPAFFWDYTGKARALGSRLETALPWLKWEPYDAAQRSRPESLTTPPADRPALYFVFIGNEMDVRSADFASLHRYVLADSKAGAVNVSPLALKPMEPEKGTMHDSVEKTGGYSADYDNPDILGKLPGVTVMSDFFRREGRLWLATTDGSKLNVFGVTDAPALLATTAIPYRGQILALKWWQPEGRPSLYLAVTCWADHKMASLIYTLEPSGLALVQERIPRILGTFDLDGDGTPETLWGQAGDRDEFYGRDIKTISLTGGGINLADPGLDLPRQFPVVGSRIGDVTGDGSPETVFIRNGILQVYSGNKRIYASPKNMGGSISVLTYDLDPTAKDTMTRSVFFEVSPFIRDIDGDGRREILAVSTDRSWIGAPGISAGIDAGRIVALKYDNGRFQVGKLASPISGPVQGLAALGGVIFLVTSEPGSYPGENRESQLLSIPLARR